MTIRWSEDPQSGGTRVRVWDCSTGFLPLSIKGAALFNVLLFWVPFRGINTYRIKEFREHLDAAVKNAPPPSAKGVFEPIPAPESRI